MEELIKTLEEIKEHQMQTVQLARTTTVYKLADKAINQALSLSAFVERSELFPSTCPSCGSYEWSYHSGVDKMKCLDCGNCS